MRSRSEIINALVAKLSTQETGAWSRIQNSVIGKELLAFGAEVIAASDNVKDSLVQAFDYKLADERALISLSHVHDVPITFFKPAYIRIRLSAAYATHLFKPFDLVYTVGNVKFTNISWCSGADDIILYQGVVKTMYTTQPLTDFNTERVEAWDTTVIPLSDDTIMTGHNIGQAMPDSVYVYYADGAAQGALSLFTPLRYGPTVQSYKLYTLFNRDIMVLDGDGEWGRKDYDDPSFQIIWLEPTDKDFSRSGKLESVQYGSVGFLSEMIVSSSQGDVDSITYARDAFRRYYLSLNAIVSEEQIKDYVNSYPYVQDCSLDCLNNIVSVYVKPTDPNDTGEFGDIESVLDIKGGILTSYQISLGTAIDFTLVVSGTNLDPTTKNEISNYLKEEFAYSKMKFNDVVDVASMAALIQTKFGVVVRTMFNISGVTCTSGSKLQFIPDRGSITIEQDGLDLGYDLNGGLYCATSTTSQPMSSIIGCFGKFAQFQDKFGKHLVKKDSSTSAHSFISADGIRSQLGMASGDDQTWYTATNNGYAFAWVPSGDGITIITYQEDAVTPAGLISSIVPISKQTANTGGVYDGIVPFYYNGQLYIIKSERDSIKVLFYSNSNEVPYYIMSIPVTDNAIGVFIQGSTVFIITHRNTAIVINHFATSRASWSTLKMDFGTQYTNYNLVAFQAYKPGICCAALVSGTARVLISSTGISVTNSRVVLQGFNKVYQFTSQFVPGRVFIYCTDEYIQYRESSGCYVVYLTTGSSFNVSTAVSSYMLNNDANIGTVNYSDGTIVYRGSGNIKFSYKSVAVNLDKSSYLVMNKENGVIWN